MDLKTSSAEQHHQRLRARKRRRITVSAALLAVIIAALVLTPPLINVNRYRKRIATTMSDSLGRPVHLDNVTLHLLPVPGLTLQNLVVSEDPAFGYEPVIRANTVEATFRASSLWRRQMEFSSVRFVEPSVNIVRNLQGRWNLEGVLMQASQVETAPTAQKRAGPEPRFPYIEATGARVNLKIGDEKMPFSLTEARFALWLPSPEQWRVRLEGKPTRTDSNVADTGSFLLEGTLKKAAHMAEVPVDLHGSWRGTPLGEASRLLTGNDAGWRGTLFTEAALTGPLRGGQLSAHVQLNDLRRGEFVPAQSLDVTVDCNATADLTHVALTGAVCGVPVDGAATPITLKAATVDMQRPLATSAETAVQSLPLAWISEWAGLFSPQITAAPDMRGVADGKLVWNPQAQSWQGRLTATLPAPAAPETDRNPDTNAAGPVLNFDIDTKPKAEEGAVLPIVRLQPAVLHPAANVNLTLSGQADANGYGLQITGTGTPAQVHALLIAVPPLTEGLDRALPPANDSRPDNVRALSLSCTRLWGGTQTCEPLVSPEVSKPPKAQRNLKRR